MRRYCRSVTTQLRRITFRCQNPAALARFWGGVLLRPVIDGSQGLHIRLVEGNQPQDLYFQPAPPGAAPGNALALGVGAVCGSLAEEVGRIEALGARTLSEHEDAAGSGWVSMADPEGNELVVEQSEEDLLDLELGVGRQARGRPTT